MAGLEDEIQKRINQQQQQAQAEKERLQQEQIASQQKHEAEKNAVLEKLQEVEVQEELETVQRELWGGKGTIGYIYYEGTADFPESVQVMLIHGFPDIRKRWYSYSIPAEGYSGRDSSDAKPQSASATEHAIGTSYVQLTIRAALDKSRCDVVYAQTPQRPLGETEEDHTEIAQTFPITSDNFFSIPTASMQAKIHDALVDYGVGVKQGSYETALSAEQKGQERVEQFTLLHQPQPPHVPLLRRIFGKNKQI
jgi:hypothetical protein